MMLNWIEVELAILIVTVIAVCFSGYQCGRRQMINELCNKSEYDFCQQVSEKKIYELKKDFLD